jgi:hypothetical protein
MTRIGQIRGSIHFVLGVVLATSSAPVAAADLAELVTKSMAVNDDGAASQVRIDKISADNDDAIGKYRNALQRVEALRHYNRQMEQLIDSQQNEMAGYRAEIDSIELIVREVTPLMFSMIDALDNFVELDVPFLIDERRGRVADLQELMLRSDITDAERYRRILEAYQIENEYGRTIEMHRGELELAGQTREVEYLRIGRVVYFYQTLDESETGVWDHANGRWTESPESRGAVRKGIRIARKQTAPDLLKLPVPAPEAAK